MLIKFVKDRYLQDISSMTKVRYIPYIDEYKKSPPPKFFDDLANYATELYQRVYDNPIDEELYRYNIPEKVVGQVDINIYYQNNISVDFDVTNSLIRFSLQDIAAISIPKMDECKFELINDKINNFTKDNKIGFILISNNNQLLILSSTSLDRISQIDNAFITSLGKDAVAEDKIIFRISPLIVLDNNNDAFIDPCSTDSYLQGIKTEKYLAIGQDDLIMNLLEVALESEDFIYQWYEQHRRNVLESKKLRELYGQYYYGIAISDLDLIKNQVIIFVLDSGLESNEKLPRTIPKVVHSRRYRGILDEELVRKCFKSLQYVNRRAHILRDYVLKDVDLNYNYLIGPVYPFVYGQSNYANMVFISTYDILMIDFDVEGSLTKAKSIDVLERFLQSQAGIPVNKSLFKTPPCFKIYETDNGVHAFLVSELIPHNTERASKIMIEVCSDINYAAMTQMKGYSVRLTPKIYKNGEYVSLDYVRKQFVQKEGLQIGNEIVNYVGDSNSIDPYIEGFVDLMYQMQQYILQYPTKEIYNALFNRDREVIDSWGDHCSKLYSQLSDQHSNRLYERQARIWARDVNTEKYLNSLTFL